MALLSLESSLRHSTQKQKKLPFLASMNFFVAYYALGESIMRIGYFLNGCCYGKAFAYGVYCPIQKENLYPTQLLCSIGMFIIYLILRRGYFHQKGIGYIFLGLNHILINRITLSPQRFPL